MLGNKRVSWFYKALIKQLKTDDVEIYSLTEFSQLPEWEAYAIYRLSDIYSGVPDKRRKKSIRQYAADWYERTVKGIDKCFVVVRKQDVYIVVPVSREEYKQSVKDELERAESDGIGSDEDS